MVGLDPGSRSGPRSAIAASLWPSSRADHEWHGDVTKPERLPQLWSQRLLACAGRVVLVKQPADHAQHVKKQRAEENTWVNMWAGEQLVEKRVREKRSWSTATK